MKTRRKFLLNCTALGAAAAFPPFAAAESLDFSSKSVSLDQIGFSRWKTELNTTFQVSNGLGKSIELKLIEAGIQPPFPNLGSEPSPDEFHEKFTLIFSGARDQALTQDTFQFEHERIGRFGLFIVPSFTLHPQIVEYAAIFNRMLRPQLKT